jgi:hypothetical protein
VDTVGVHATIPNAERLRVNIDVTFHALACELITLDTMDQAGGWGLWVCGFVCGILRFKG